MRFSASRRRAAQPATDGSEGPVVWALAVARVARGAGEAGNAANLLLGEERYVKTPGPDMLNIRHRRQLK